MPHFVLSTCSSKDIDLDGILHDCDVEVTSQYAVTVGQDRQLRLWDLDSCRFFDSHDAAPVDCGACVRVRVDPSGMMAACCFANGCVCADTVICLSYWMSNRCLNMCLSFIFPEDSSACTT